ncbi:hypothetical protein L484_007407 [Morus notabilis]|uniref:Uncharacterized protein n=1 Tax=Morus notabilis TaxID=981085 RepID=W9QXT0_9ROSA|nr:hypothetical protein L484_007407 [Morus notabilis]
MVSDHQTDVDSLRNDTSPEYGGGGSRRVFPRRTWILPPNLTLLSPLVRSISHHSSCISTYRDRQRRHDDPTVRSSEPLLPSTDDGSGSVFRPNCDGDGGCWSGSTGRRLLSRLVGAVTSTTAWREREMTAAAATIPTTTDGGTPARIEL